MPATPWVRIAAGLMVERLQPDDPRLLGSYIVLGRLGKGGMGLVYLGQAGNGSLVAIKVVRKELAGDPAAMRRFRREVQAASRVPRHFTAPVVGFDLEHHPAYIATEYVRGPTLHEAVADGPLSGSELLERVWDEHADPFTNTVRVTVGNLRRKLGQPPLIQTVIGAGYRL
jgi:serine/threonine protein kinase